MTQKERILWLFRMNGNRLSLGQLLADPSGVGYKCTSRFSELRDDGFDIRFHKGKTASENVYELVHYDKSGQGSLGL